MNVINVGNSPDDNNGDPLRNAFIKINANFVELLAAVSGELGATVTLNFDEMVAIQAAMPALVSDYASLTAAVAAIGSQPKTLLIDADTAITTSTTVPDTLVLKTSPGQLVTVPTGMVLSIGSRPDAGLYQWLDCQGTGAVIFPAGVVLSPEWWGAKADGVWTAGADLYGMNSTSGVTCVGTDSTASINAATACAMVGGSVVEFQSGTYLASVLNFDSGVQWIGKGTKKTAVAAGNPSGTVLKQIGGPAPVTCTNDDFVQIPSGTWIESASIRGIRFIGDPTGTATAGSGINFDKTAGENFFMDDVRCDYFPWFGVKFNRGVQPCVLNNVHLFWNGYGTGIEDPVLGNVGSGLCLTRTDSDVMQAGQFSNISGDSNVFALIYVKSGPPGATNGGSLLFSNIKAETGVRDLQPDVFVLNNCAGTNITINNCSNLNTGQSNLLSITKANPGVITTGDIIESVPTPIPHGLLVDDYVTIHSPGMVELSGNTYKVNTVPTTSTLTLKTVAGVPVNTTAYTDYTSGGFVQLNTNSLVRIVDAVDPVNTAEPALCWIGLAAENSTRNILVDEVNSVTLPNTGGSRYQNGYYGISGFYSQYGVTFGNAITNTDTSCLNRFKRGTVIAPVLTFSSVTDYTPDPAVTNGRATRIGDVVTFSMQVAITSKGTSSGTFTIGPLPYANIAVNASCVVRVSGMAGTIGDSYLEGYVVASGTTIIISKMSGGGATALQASDLGGTASIIVSGQYFTDAS